MTKPDTDTKEVAAFVPFDIGELDTVKASNEGAELELLHPVTLAKTGVFIGLLGKDSNIMQDYLREKENEGRRLAALANKQGRDVDVPTVEETSEQGIELLVMLTTHWRTGPKDHPQAQPKFYLNKEWLDFTPANVAKVYRDFPKIREQVDKAIMNLSLFMKA